MTDPTTTRPPERTGDERRTTNPDDCVTHAQLDRRLEFGRTAMIQHFDDRFDGLESLIKSGFPGGDPRRHCEVHEGFIQDAEDRRALWKSVREKTITGGVYALAGFVAMAVWEAIKIGVVK